MISYLKGIIIEKNPTRVVVEVGDVAYELEIPLSTYEGIGNPGEEVKIYTRLYFRDDTFQLFGFSHPEERTLFEILTSVSGIGPQLARGILSHVSVESFARAIFNSDVNAIVAIPGIGKKTAQRLLLELHDTIPKIFPEVTQYPEHITQKKMLEEAYSALVQLGYHLPEAKKLVNEVSESLGNISSVEELIRESLKRVK
jgi:Holliday junction DNA helicase RuvA